MTDFDRVPVLGILVLLLLLPLGRVWGLESGGTKAANAPKVQAAEITPEQFNAMKAEWEEVREGQIQMIREKEEQLEKLKEDLFQKLRAAEGAPQLPAVPVPGTSQAARDKIQSEAFALQKKAEELAAREKALASREAVLAQKAAAAAAVARPEDLTDAKQEFERQKRAFAAERQKFFQEMNRQKEKLRALQISLDAQAKKMQESCVHSGQEKPAAGR